MLEALDLMTQCKPGMATYACDPSIWGKRAIESKVQGSQIQSNFETGLLYMRPYVK